MVKKFLCLFIALLLTVVCITVAAGTKKEISIDVGEEFFVLGTDEKAISIFNMPEDQLYDYCAQNDIIYLAVNENRSKQVQVIRSKSQFTETVGNLSLISGEKLESLMPDIIGTTSLIGEIIEKQGQKFIVTKAKSADIGGEYTVTQYITIANENRYILSFYTSGDADTAYIDEIFNSFDSSYFLKPVKENVFNKIIVPLLIGILSIVSIVIVITIIKDLIKNKKIKELEGR